MRYERPTILRREPIAGLLIMTQSDATNDTDSAPSDVNRKANILPVVWEPDAPIAYTSPQVVRRESLEALLDTVKSVPQKQPPTTGVGSDRNIKANVVAVVWDASARAEYEKPGVDRRERLDALLATTRSDGQQNDASDISDRNLKDHIVPVRW